MASGAIDCDCIGKSPRGDKYNIKVFVGCHYSAAGTCLSLLDPFTNTATTEKYLLVTLSAVYTANREEYYS